MITTTTVLVTKRSITVIRASFQPARRKHLTPRKYHHLILPYLQVLTDIESTIATTKQQQHPYSQSTVLGSDRRRCMHHFIPLLPPIRFTLNTRTTTDQQQQQQHHHHRKNSNSNYYYSARSIIPVSNSSRKRTMSTVTTTTGVTSNKTVLHHDSSNNNDNNDGSITPSTTTTTHTNTELNDIEELHERACTLGQMSYIDPTTGFTCFTRVAHLQRGVCCGNYCRHCPYSWKNAKSKTTVNDDDDDASSSSSSTSSDESSQADSNGQHKSLSLHMNELALNDDRPSRVPVGTTSTTTSSKTKTGGKYGGTMTKKNVVYTRGGDTGTSQLLNGERRMKSDIVFEALGTVDELCSVVGVCYAELNNAIQSMSRGNETHIDQIKELELVQEWLLEIMSRLFDIGSHVAKPRKESTTNSKIFIPDGVGNGFDSIHIQELEIWIDTMTEALPELTSFVLPTGSRVSAQLHVARTVCRRTERTIVPLVVAIVDHNDNNNDDSEEHTTTTTSSGCDPNALAYINRLSDFFFTAARYVNDRLRVPDIAYQRPTRGAKQRTRVVLKSPNAANET